MKMYKKYTVVTDGNVFRVTEESRGCNPRFVGIPDPLEFTSKEQAERYIHNSLSMSGWKPA
jgi:hypothetical protein